MRRRDSALKRSRSAMVVFPQAWIWTAIIMAMAICAAIPLLYQRNRQVWLHSTEGLRTLRQARTDLAKGFLHASLGDDPASPFNRDQGLALIAQATSQFDDLGEPPPEGVELAALAEFRQEAARFRDLVMAQRQRDPGQETRIRIAYHRLESEADQIDSAIERALMKRDEQFDTQQRLLISMAALLLGICAVGVHLAGRAQKQAMEFLMESESRYRLLVDTANEAIYVIQDGQIRFANKQCEILAGLPMEQLSGRSIFDFALPEERAQLIEEHRRMIAGEIQNTRYTVRARFTDQQLRWMMINSVRVNWNGTPATLNLATDITEIKQAETALDQQRRNYEMIVGSAMDAIITFDSRYRIVVFNATAEQIFRCPAAEAIGQPAPRFIPTVAKAAKQAGGTTPAPARHLIALKGLRADGEEFLMEASLSRVDVDGRILQTVICRDVTDRDQAEAVRQKLESQLRQAQKMEAIGHLAGGIAHDFNNILGAILGNTELARMDVTPQDPVGECLDEIAKAGWRAKSLVQKILTFSRQQTTERAITNLDSVVDESLDMLRATIPAGIRLVKEIAPDVPAVLADSTQIHQIVVNLCTNSWHAIERETGRILVEVSAIDLDESGAAEMADLPPGRYAVIRVSDDGKGMDEKTLEHIFDPFFTTKEPGQGTGLGLSVVHGIVKDHGGAIQVESRLGRGTTFRIWLPAALESEPPPPTAPQAIRPSRRRILYLDDEPQLVSMAARMITRLGHEVRAFTEPQEALDFFLTDPNRIDILITDLNMPEISGFKLAAEVLARRPDLPVVISSGNIPDSLKLDARRLGIRHFILKPHSFDELARLLAALITPSPAPNGPNPVD